MHSPEDRGPSSEVGTSVSGETAIVLSAEDAKLLTEVGFLAADQGDVASADAVFDVLCRLRPDRAYPWLGKALARFYAGRADEAVLFLERASCLDKDETGVLHAWHGLALQLAGHHAQSRALLERVAPGHGPGPQLARTLLGLPKEN
ncbi:hypothetical protein [Bordetella tumulicola]|uniref:hypothetical protein n=1 Tax=Bordetella tumulicola TaxID=1649133 RepID=UPI0039EF417E